jgi:hypothetical protein
MEELLKMMAQQQAQQAAMQAAMQKQMEMFQKIAASQVSPNAAAVLGGDMPITPTVPKAVTPPPSPSLPKKRRSPRLKAKVKVEGEGKRKRDGRPLKRSLSFEQAVAGGTRQKKSKEDHQLRTELRLRLCELDDKLLKGHFHHPGTNKFVFVLIAVLLCSVFFCFFAVLFAVLPFFVVVLVFL